MPFSVKSLCLLELTNVLFFFFFKLFDIILKLVFVLSQSHYNNSDFINFKSFLIYEFAYLLSLLI